MRRTLLAIALVGLLAALAPAALAGPPRQERPTIEPGRPTVGPDEEEGEGDGDGGGAEAPAPTPTAVAPTPTAEPAPTAEPVPTPAPTAEVAPAAAPAPPTPLPAAGGAEGPWWAPVALLALGAGLALRRAAGRLERG